jgi:plasmid stabilization system protein ParE
VSFTVVWKPEAERRLATIWTDATDRNAVTRAAGAIDKALKNDPEHLGESRGYGRQIWLEDPLGVVFRVSPPDRMVTVLTVWKYERRGKS